MIKKNLFSEPCNGNDCPIYEEEMADSTEEAEDDLNSEGHIQLPNDNDGDESYSDNEDDQNELLNGEQPSVADDNKDDNVPEVLSDSPTKDEEVLSDLAEEHDNLADVQTDQRETEKPEDLPAGPVDLDEVLQGNTDGKGTVQLGKGPQNPSDIEMGPKVNTAQDQKVTDDEMKEAFRRPKPVSGVLDPHKLLQGKQEILGENDRDQTNTTPGFSFSDFKDTLHDSRMFISHLFDSMFGQDRGIPPNHGTATHNTRESDRDEDNDGVIIEVEDDDEEDITVPDEVLRMVGQTGPLDPNDDVTLRRNKKGKGHIDDP